jgi:molecular chaperone DnaK
MDMQLTRQQFDSMTADLVDRTVTPVENALHDAGLGKQDIDMVLLVGGSTRIPAVQDKVRKLMGKEPSRNLNPDECVAMGAAIQGGKLSGQLVSSGGAADIILMDVTPMSLSIETLGGIASRIIERNTTIPTRHSQIFTTAGNFQTSVEIKVYQGERKFTRDNKLLGNFKLSGIKRAMAGTPQIEVTFDIDVNGIVNVSAKDLGTGNLQSITITSNSNMTEEEIERAKWEAEVFEKQDSQAGEQVQLVIDAKNLTNRAHAELSSRKKELDKDAKKRVKEAINSLEKALGRVKPENVTADEAEKIAAAKSGLEQTLADVGINV